MADWLQAVGSLLAVIVALGIALASWFSQRAKDRDKELRFKQTACALLELAAKRIALVDRIAQRDVPLAKKFQPNVMKRVQIMERRISEFPIQETAEPRLIHIFVITEDRLRMVRGRCRRWNSTMDSGSSTPEKEKRLLAALKKNRNDSRRYATEASELAKK